METSTGNIQIDWRLSLLIWIISILLIIALSKYILA